MALISEALKANAGVYHGNAICQEKCQFLLKEVGLPSGLLPLQDIIECGFVEETGFVWLKQKKKIEHYFKKVGRHVTYGPDITAYIGKLSIKKLTGVKAKELFMWLTVTDISLTAGEGEKPATEAKVVFHSSSGIFRTFPAAAFEKEFDGEVREAEVEKM
ncbi:hypothetical protein KFK09_011423 [Dendrobium nobile]|uniref:Uncharacterized protein n=1 Tax=Dendrobium nobile TaxID=94219 RepID=A0A8T3BEH6_DENNO|nr:hypothetical protein KFK09_011423 [Dendrobium nobile]